MDTEDEQLLAAGIWRLELKRLAHCCLSCGVAEEDRAVRVAFYLLQLSPPAIRRMSQSRLSEAHLEALLEDGRAEEAARRIVGQLAAIELSNAAGHMPHVAILRCDDEAVRSKGTTPALAMVSAWAALLNSGRSAQTERARSNASARHRVVGIRARTAFDPPERRHSSMS